MIDCPACGTENNENDKYCSKCGANLHGINCPNCNEEVDETTDFCTNCGINLKKIREKEKILENDPEVNELVNSYSSICVARRIFGFVLGISLFLFYQSLESNVSDSIGAVSLLILLPSLIVFIILCICSGVKNKKIMNLIDKKYNLMNNEPLN